MKSSLLPFLFVFLFPAPAFPALDLTEIHYVMGTLFRITVYVPSEKQGRSILHRCFQETRRLESVMSLDVEDSDVNRVNTQAGQGWVQVDEDLFRILTVSRRLAQATGGTFDVTVGPFMEVWNRAVRIGRLPRPVDLAQVRRRVGSEKLWLFGGGKVGLARPDMRIDLGGIGKGYAVDRAVEILRREGIRRGFLSFGESSIYALGSPPGKKFWTVWVRGFSNGEFRGPIQLRDRALSTSASWGQTWKIRGRTFGHIIDPRSGWPLSAPAVAVITGPSATETEGFSKALLILGVREGQRVLERAWPVEGLLITGREVFVSSGFPLGPNFGTHWQKRANEKFYQ